MRLTRTRLALFGTVAALVVAASVVTGNSGSNDEPIIAIQSQPTSAAPLLQISTEETKQREADAQRIAYAKANYGVHFDHPANAGVTDPTKFLPYTNVWADIRFRGQGYGGTYLSPIVKTFGDIKVSIPAKPRKEVSPNADRPGETRTIYLWEMTVTFGSNATYYMTMYNSNRTDSPNITETFDGWTTFVGDNAGKAPKGKKSVDVMSARQAEHVIITGTNPAKRRDRAMDGLPITWRDLATVDLHLPVF